MEKKKVETSQKILIIVLLIILFVLLCFTRKYVIISSIWNKAMEYSTQTNYHIKNYQYQADGYIYIITDTFSKGDKSITKRSFYRAKTSSMLVETIDVKNGSEYSMYMTAAGEEGNIIKNATMDTNSLNTNPFLTGFEDMPMFEYILFIILSKVDTTTVNGKPCYAITVSDSEMKNILYFDKETGLKVREIFIVGTMNNNGEMEYKDNVCDREYEFGNVTDEDLTPPDISEYNVSNNN